MAAGSDLGFFLIQVAGIAVDRKHYITFAICENCRFLHGEIVHDLLASLCCIDGGFRLFHHNCTEGGEYRATTPLLYHKNFPVIF